MAHSEFLATCKRLALVIGRSDYHRISDDEAKRVIETGNWLEKYLADRAHASASRINPGRKRKPDGEISEASLKRREYRAKGGK